MSTTSSDSFRQRGFNESRRSSSRSLSNSQTSWRSLSSSKTIDSVREAIRNSTQLSSETKNKLKKVYKEYELGQISREQLKTIVQKDLNLETNSTFEKSLKSVNMNYTSLIRGIEKREISLMTNFKPNTKDEQLAKQTAKTVSLNLYQQQRNPYQATSTETIVKPQVFSDEKWLQKQLDDRIPDQKLFLPEKIMNADEKEKLQVQKEYRLPTLSHQLRNICSYTVKKPAPEETLALKNNGDILNLKAKPAANSTINSAVSSSTDFSKTSEKNIASGGYLFAQKVSGLKKVSGTSVMNQTCNQEKVWKSPTERKLTQIKNSENFFDQDFLFRTAVVSPKKGSQSIRSMHTSSTNILTWN